MPDNQGPAPTGWKLALYWTVAIIWTGVMAYMVFLQGQYMPVH